MGDLVNLNRARKARERAAGKALAAVNRAAHGRPKAERALADAERAAADRALDGARRESAED